MSEDAVSDFLELSAALTGFSRVDLSGTGLVETYYNEVREIVGERIFGRLLLTSSRAHEIDAVAKAIEVCILRDECIGPVARNLIRMWYLGNWTQMPRAWRANYGASARDCTRVISAHAYREGLMWRAIDAHPPTAKSPGFGSWTAPPDGALEIDDRWKR